MTIEGIGNGIVIDHIRAGFGIKVLGYLGATGKSDTVAFIMNAPSKKHSRKDIIKLENTNDLDLTVLGLIDHNATVNVIKNHEIVDKIKLSLPEKVTNVIRCKNPRCVTSIESISHTFQRVGDSDTYHCVYCDDLVKADAYLK
ncbi:MAG: aspartate carbamoyltransferase regulatory subunit [Defluviitaleaceae bacterium]|nr:aspartate carbamoyltransferase regulatory subunit [Defluviitaleaceae bacterium]